MNLKFLFLFISLFFSLCFVNRISAASAADPPLFLRRIPQDNTTFKYLKTVLPEQISQDNSGNFYIADSYLNQVIKVDSSGNFLASWGSLGFGDGQFNQPKGIVLSPNGFIYVADSVNRRIQKFDLNGNFLAKWGSAGSGDGQFQLPSQLSLDSADNVYVADTFNNRIQKFDSNGNFLLKWSGDSQTNSTMNLPCGITIDSSGNVLVADGNHNRIQKFDSNGSLITQWGSYGFSDGQFYAPCGLAIDVSGNIFVADSNNNRIEKFDSSGNFLAKWGSQGSSPGQYNLPHGIFITGNNVYIIDTSNARIQIFDTNGFFQKQWASAGGVDQAFRSPHDIAVNNNGETYVIDSGLSMVKKFDTDGNFLTKWGSFGQNDGQLEGAMGIAVDFADNVYVADTNNHRIQKFNANGNFLKKWGSRGFGDGQFNSPVGIIIDSSNNVYVGGVYDNRIQKFDSNGNFLSKIILGQGVNSTALAIDSLGNYYLTDTGNNQIQKYDSTGNFLAKWGGFGLNDGLFKSPTGIALDDFGNVYVVDRGNGRIQKFDADGNFLTKWGSLGFLDNQFYFPYGIKILGRNIYIANRDNSRIDIYQNPVIGVPTGSVMVNNSNKYTNSVDVTLTLAVFDDLTPPSQIEMILSSNANFNGAVWEPFAGSKPWTLSTGDGTKTVYVKFKDTDNNVSAVYSDSIILDTVIPTGSININDGAFYTTNSTVNVSLAASDNLSLNSELQIMIGNDNNFTGSSWQNFADSVNWTLSLDDGLKTVYAKFKDAAGNISLVYSDTITLDSTSPVGSISINNDASFSNSLSAVLTISTSDNISSTGQIGMMVAESLDFSGSIWEAYITTKDWLFASGDGTKIVYVKFKDEAGNISAIYSDSIVIDTTAPTGSILINNGETSTNSAAVNITLAASDNISALENLQMMISNTADFLGGAWEAFAVSRIWAISLGDGLKTVYIQYKDETGNISDIYSDDITLDTRPVSAVFAQVLPPDGTTVNTQYPTFEFRRATDITNIDHYEIMVTPLGGAEYSLFGIIPDVSPNRNKNYLNENWRYILWNGDFISAYGKGNNSLANNSYTWHVKGVDTLGQTLYTSTWSLIVNVVNPKALTINGNNGKDKKTFSSTQPLDLLNKGLQIVSNIITSFL